MREGKAAEARAALAQAKERQADLSAREAGHIIPAAQTPDLRRRLGIGVKS